jgi:hypothetical protein
LSFSMMFFFVSLAFWIGRFLFRRIVKTKSGGAVVQGKHDSAPGLIAGALCALSGAYLVILLGYSEMIPYGQDIQTGYSGLFRIVLLAVPWLGIVLLGASISFTWVIWKRRLWKLIGRVHYTLIALIALADVVVCISWDIIP